MCTGSGGRTPARAGAVMCRLLKAAGRRHEPTRSVTSSCATQRSSGTCVGHVAIGIYPLIPGDRCWFLAFDLDGRSWRRDACALAETAHELGVAAAVERSRSGDGATCGCSSPRRYWRVPRGSLALCSCARRCAPISRSPLSRPDSISERVSTAHSSTRSSSPYPQESEQMPGGAVNNWS